MSGFLTNYFGRVIFYPSKIICRKSWHGWGWNKPWNVVNLSLFRNVNLPRWYLNLPPRCERRLTPIFNLNLEYFFLQCTWTKNNTGMNQNFENSFNFKPNRYKTRFYYTLLTYGIQADLHKRGSWSCSGTNKLRSKNKLRRYLCMCFFNLLRLLECFTWLGCSREQTVNMSTLIYSGAA